MVITHRLRDAAFPGLVHFGISGLVATLTFALVFLFWFPSPLDQLTGGRDLFLLLVTIDLVCGPLLTCVVFDRRKTSMTLFIDFTIIGLIQIAALLYGLWSVSLARPVTIAFETDRFRIITAAEVLTSELNDSNELPWFSISTTGVSGLSPTDEGYLESLDLSLQGIPPSARPSRWISYEEIKLRVASEARSIDELRRKHEESGRSEMIDIAIKQHKLSEVEIGYWPLESRIHNDWVVLVGRSDGQIKGYVNLDPW